MNLQEFTKRIQAAIPDSMIRFDGTNLDVIFDEGGIGVGWSDKDGVIDVHNYVFYNGRHIDVVGWVVGFIN